MINSVEQITPGWLNALLSEDRVLDRANVTAVQVEPLAGVWNSRAYRLRVAYSGDTLSAPAQLFLKLKGEHWGREEAQFYSYLHTARADMPMLVPCFGSEYDEATGDSYVLLADLSETHFTPFSIAQFRALQVVPDPVYLQQIIDCVAGFHAYWWEHTLLGSGFAALSPFMASQESFEARLEKRGADLAAFLSSVGDGLPQNVASLLKEVHSRLPTIWDRYLADRVRLRRALTLINGDCYFIQFLCPYHPDKHRTYMVDLDSISACLPAYDLMYLFTTFWTREQRTENGREIMALKRYYEVLQQGGIGNYNFDDLLLDYRLSIAENVLHPAWDQQNGSSESYWQPKLSCLVAAFEDWDCMELLW